MASHPKLWWKVAESVVKGMPDVEKTPEERTNGRTEPVSGIEAFGFTGCYNHGIDAKGRVIVPVSYRKALGEQFVAALTIDRKAIALYPVTEWMRENEKLKALSEKDARMKPIYAFMSKYTYPCCETDAQGRVLLPAKLRSKILGTAQNVEVSGAGNYVRIVEASAGEAEDEAIFENIPDILAFIAEIQKQ